MKAIVHTQYGPPEVLELQDVDRPTAAADEVLVRVEAASVNAADWHVMRGKPFLMRLMGFGVRTPSNPRFGADVAGKIEAVGSDVTGLEPGDTVFGDLSDSRGSFAEYAVANQDAVIPIPDGVSIEAAAATPLAGVTALQGLRDEGEIEEGESVLLVGASGGVGTFAVQLATHFGAEVTGVCRTEKVDTVRSIGAEDVIDYTEVDFTETDEQYDLILDAGAYRSVFASRRPLGPGGRYVLVGGALGPMLQTMALGPLLSRVGDTQVRGLMAEPDRDDLAVVAERLADGSVDPVIDRSFPLAEVPEAIAYLEAGEAIGKVLVTVEGG